MHKADVQNHTASRQKACGTEPLRPALVCMVFSGLSGCLSFPAGGSPRSTGRPLLVTFRFFIACSPIFCRKTPQRKMCIPTYIMQGVVSWRMHRESLHIVESTMMRRRALVHALAPVGERG